MRYLLDPNAVIELLAANAAVHMRLRQHQPRDVVMSAIVAHELFFGAYKSTRITRNLARIDTLRLEVLAFDQEDARQAGEIRAVLTIAGLVIGPYDFLIAGQAKARDLILVTHNTKEFSRVEGLQVEDWQV